MSEITNIGRFLLAELGEPILYVANNGNAGDALMACATYDIFRNLGLTYHNCGQTLLSDSTKFRDKVVVFSGGGNLNEGGYNNYAPLLRQANDWARKVVVLPHSVNGNIDLLSTLGPNVVLICRERMSYEHTCRVAQKGARIYLAPDMAFGLNLEAALNHDPEYVSSMLRKTLWRLVDRKRSLEYPAIRHYFSGLRWENGGYKVDDEHGSERFLFRTDIESTDVELPEGNIDASLAFAFGVSTEIKARFTVLHLLRFLSKQSVIRTNRLHIAIASAILGKEVHLYANNYFKCRAVYEYSLRDRFENVIWHD